MKLSEETIATIALWQVYGLGSRKFRSLLEFFGNAEEILKAPYEQLRKIEGISQKLAQQIAQTQKSDANEELNSINQYGLTLLAQSEKNYPALLQEIYNPPPILYCRGNLNLNARLCIAFVGSRKFSYYGKEQTKRLIQEIAKIDHNIIIISGLALGIDTIAHQTALDVGLKTVAVLAGGLSDIYPPQNRRLAVDIVNAGGMLMTEFTVRTRPMAGNFPLRNRIISGVSKGLVVVEAGEKSGALISARCALEQNRELFAVPGAVDHQFSRGTNRLIQKGNAKLIIHAEDILEELQTIKINKGEQISFFEEPSVIATLQNSEKQILNLLQKEALDVDRIIQKSSLSIGNVLGILTNLELKGMITTKVGGLYQVTSDGLMFQ
ncbi:MAG: DNA processing protein [bacterium]|jgi:DNA processing protein